MFNSFKYLQKVATFHIEHQNLKQFLLYFNIRFYD